MSKQYYTWEEVKALPMGTVFKWTQWLYMFKESNGNIDLFSTPAGRDNWAELEPYIQLTYQRFELFEEPEPQHVKTLEAFNNLFTLKWSAIRCKTEDFCFILGHQGHIVMKDAESLGAISPFLEVDFLYLDWCEYKEIEFQAMKENVNKLAKGEKSWQRERNHARRQDLPVLRGRNRACECH